MTDWRLQGQERFLERVVLHKRRYHTYRDDWDHDHCEFCGAKFSEAPDDLHEGYTTADGYHWICDPCYEDFKSLFQWPITSSPTEEVERE